MEKGKIVYYTVYLAENDEIVAYGTPDECAKMLGMSKNTFFSIVCHTKGGRLNKYEFCRELVDREEYRDLQSALFAQKFARMKGASA